MGEAGQQRAEARTTAGVVLVADDTPVMRKACQRSLERAGHTVIIAEDGNRALEVVRNEDIDVALLDIKMPGVGGIEVLKAIKSEKPLVEVIMMTAHATQDIAEKAGDFGSSGFLTKPFDDVKVLVDTVNRAVSRKKLRETGGGACPDLERLLLAEGLVTPEQAGEIGRIIRASLTGASRPLGELIENARAAKGAERPRLVREILEVARIKSVDEAEFEKVGNEWRFRIEGVIEER